MDTDLFRAINDLQASTDWLHSSALFYAKTGGPALLALLLIIGFLVARRRRSEDGVARALWAGLSTLVSVGLNQPIVHLVDRTRPYLALPHVHLLGHPSTDGSFPSDHGTLAGAALAGLFLVDKRLGITATVAGIVLAFGRVYVGAHYPGDVLAGLAFGALVALIGWPLVRRPVTWFVDRLFSGPLRPLVSA